MTFYTTNNKEETNNNKEETNRKVSEYKARLNKFYDYMQSLAYVIFNLNYLFLCIFNYSM